VQVETVTEPVESATAQVEAVTEPVESATAQVEAATEPVESATAQVETATEPVESATVQVETATEPVESATEQNEPIEQEETMITSAEEAAAELAEIGFMAEKTADLLTADAVIDLVVDAFSAPVVHPGGYVYPTDPAEPGAPYVIVCPYCLCDIAIPRDAINCAIFRHASHKASGEPINPHASKEECDRLLSAGEIYGCTGPFRFDGTTVERCGYDT
jgi:hypothetical protein